MLEAPDFKDRIKSEKNGKWLDTWFQKGSGYKEGWGQLSLLQAVGIHVHHLFTGPNTFITDTVALYPLTLI